jgi:phosphate-selective porin OprO and OprP
VIQRVRFTGGLDLQYAAGTSNAGTYGSRDLSRDDRWGPIDVRRWRLGAEVAFFKQFVFDPEFNLGPRADAFYGDIFQMYIEWKPADWFQPAVGKIRVPFTQEYRIPDSEIVTIERSLLVETLLAPSLTGAMLGGDVGHWSYRIGAFAADERDEFSRFDDGATFIGTISHEFEDVFGLESFRTGIDYHHNTSPDDTGPGPYAHAVSFWSHIEQGRLNLLSEFIYARGDGEQPDVYGLHILPSMFVYRDVLQVVLRYQFAISDGDGGRTLQPRYEALAPDLQAGGVGRRYHAGYAGINWYLCPDIKLITGVEYHHMTGGDDSDDFRGLTWAVAFRFWF